MIRATWLSQQQQQPGYLKVGEIDLVLCIFGMLLSFAVRYVYLNVKCYIIGEIKYS